MALWNQILSIFRNLWKLKNRCLKSSKMKKRVKGRLKHRCQKIQPILSKPLHKAKKKMISLLPTKTRSGQSSCTWEATKIAKIPKVGSQIMEMNLLEWSKKNQKLLTIICGGKKLAGLGTR